MQQVVAPLHALADAAPAQVTVRNRSLSSSYVKTIGDGSPVTIGSFAMDTHHGAAARPVTLPRMVRISTVVAGGRGPAANPNTTSVAYQVPVSGSAVGVSD